MIYLDYQATTPLAPEARAAMLPYLDAAFGNPHSPHRMGREAAAAVEVARDRIMATLGPDVAAGRLLFTSGATEAINWAIKGSFARLHGRRPKIVTIATEHACVLDTVRYLESKGAEVAVVPVESSGMIDLDRIADTIDDRTALVAAMLVNNEIGVIHDIAAIGGIAHARGALMLCDAVQGFGRVVVPVESCDLIAISAHKVHGPKGIGALWIRRGAEPEPLLHGGGQEGGLRSGTLSPALCAAFGVAADLARTGFAGGAAHARGLFDRARTALGADWVLNGTGEPRWPGNLNVRRDGLDVTRLMSDLRTVAFSAGSACASGSGRTSHVLRAIGLRNAEAKTSIRLGFGRYTTADDIDRAIALIVEAADRQRVFA